MWRLFDRRSPESADLADVAGDAVDELGDIDESDIADDDDTFSGDTDGSDDIFAQLHFALADKTHERRYFVYPKLELAPSLSET